MSNTTDVIIIGAGVHGASLAFHLAQRGVKSLVLEKNFIGAGATGRSSGLVRMHYDVRQDSELAWVSFGYFRNWAERVGGDTGCGFTRTGFIQIVARENEDALRKNTAMQQEVGIPTFLISADDVRRLAPSFLNGRFRRCRLRTRIRLRRPKCDQHVPDECRKRERRASCAGLRCNRRDRGR